MKPKLGDTGLVGIQNATLLRGKLGVTVGQAIFDAVFYEEQAPSRSSNHT